MARVVLKQCKQCLISKDVSEFNKHPGTRDRLNPKCKKCLAENARHRREAPGFKDQERKNGRRWRARTDAEKISAGLPTRGQAYYAENKERFKSRANWPIGTLGVRLKSAKQHAAGRGLEFSITLNDLIELFTTQNGKCAVSGKILEPGGQRGGGKKSPNTLSLDRINSAIGYVKGNVRLVSWIVNAAKHSYDDVVLIELARDVVANEAFDYGC